MSEKMIFCVGGGKYKSQGKGYQKNYQIFNQPVSEDEYKKVENVLDTKNFKLPLTAWVKVEDIKGPTTIQTQAGGYLKTQSYADAWEEMWSNLSQEEKNFITSIVHFDKNIFKEITGIDVEEKAEELTTDEVCEELGRTIKIKK